VSKMDTSTQRVATNKVVSLTTRNIEGRSPPCCSLSEGSVCNSDRTTAIVRGLDLILLHHGADQRVRTCLDTQIHAYLDSSVDEVVWLKKAKWLLSYPLAKYLRNELPPSPGDVFTPSGPLRDWMKQRLVSYCRRNTHLWYSWFQAKRSALPASDDYVEKTYEDHFKSLTRDDPGDDDVIRRIFEDRTFLSVLDKVRCGLTERFASGRVFDEMTASNSACFENTRGGGGQHGHLRTLVGFDSHCGDELVTIRWYPRVHGREGSTNVVVESRREDGDLWWSRLRGLAGQIKLDQPTCCTIQAVLEPFKVRVISKGEALPYYTMRPLQKAMHGTMRSMDCFRLIGRPLSAIDIYDCAALAHSDWKWFSIDYSAATDGLSWKYSGRILKEIIKCLPQYYQDMAMKVLGPHALHYPCGSKKVFKGVQRNGQLMGSILSFPILCLANLGVYLLNMQEEQLCWTNEERLRHVLVNGDDMVYAGPQSVWNSHISLSEKVGLKMSVGKAYIHSSYLNVNSTSIVMELDGIADKPRTNGVMDLSQVPAPWTIPYLNTGLFYGQHKVQGRRDDEQLEYAADHHSWEGGLVDNLNVVLNGSLPGRQCDLLRYFLYTHHDQVKRESEIEIREGKVLRRACRNLFVPRQCGGMGVEPPVGWKYDISRLDQELAYSLRETTAFRTKSLPLPGPGLLDVIGGARAPWSKPMTDDPCPYIRNGRKVCSKEWVRHVGFAWWPSQAYSGVPRRDEVVEGSTIAQTEFISARMLLGVDPYADD